MNGLKRICRNRKSERGGYTLLELVVSSSVGSILVAGLSGSLYIASQSFDRIKDDNNVSTAQEILGTMMRDLNQAIRFTERTASAVTFTVPDRTGDRLPETIRYAWGGSAGDPLTYEYNGSAPVTLASDVQNLDFSYLTRFVIGNVVQTAGSVTFEEFTEARHTQSDADAGALNISTPAGTATGDLLIAAVATDSNTISGLVAPTGWTQLSVASQSNKVTFSVWWKLASASESGNQQFLWTNAREQGYGWIMRFTGHDLANPIHASATGSGKSNSPTSPAVTTTVENAMILRLGGFDDDDITVDSSGLSGHTTITMAESSASSQSASGGGAYVEQSSAGDSGTANFLLTSSEEYNTVTIAIQPAL